MTTSATDTAAHDQVIELALTNGDFSAVRKALLASGYPIPEDEIEPDLYSALFKSMEIDLDEDVEIDEQVGLTVYIESLIRDRNSDGLRLMLFMNGHKIEKPEFVKRLAAECSDQSANETLVHFTHRPPEPF
jgi:hypothetical protein